MAHEGTCVDVHRGHGFGLVDDEVTAGFQLHLALKGTLDLVLHIVEIEDGRLAGVVLQLAGQLGHILAGEVRKQLEALAGIDADLVELGTDEVAHYPEGQAGILVEDLARRVLLLALQDLAPQALQEGGILLQLLLSHPFGSGTDDVATQLVHIARHGALEALALRFGLDALGDADVGTARHEDQVAGRQCDVGGETGTLGAQGIFHHLHHDVLALAHQLGDVARLELLLLLDRHALGVGHYVGGVQEGGLVHADVDEGGLHAGQHPADLALVDVANDAALGLTFYMHFLQQPVLDQGDPGL